MGAPYETFCAIADPARHDVNKDGLITVDEMRL